MKLRGNPKGMFKAWIKGEFIAMLMLAAISFLILAIGSLFQ